MPEGQGPWGFENFKLPWMRAPNRTIWPPFICYLATDEAACIGGSVFSVGGQSVSLYGEADIASTITKYGGRWTLQELTQYVPRGLIQGHRSSTMQMYESAAGK